MQEKQITGLALSMTHGAHNEKYDATTGSDFEFAIAELDELRDKLAVHHECEVAELRAENERLRGLLRHAPPALPEEPCKPIPPRPSSPVSKFSRALSPQATLASWRVSASGTRLVPDHPLPPVTTAALELHDNVEQEPQGPSGPHAFQKHLCALGEDTPRLLEVPTCETKFPMEDPSPPEETPRLREVPVRETRFLLEDPDQTEDGNEMGSQVVLPFRQSIASSECSIAALELRTDWRPDESQLRRMHSAGGRMSTRNDTLTGNRRLQTSFEKLKSMSAYQSEMTGAENSWMLHPQSNFCLIWDIVNLLLIMYEIIVTPVQVFVVTSLRLVPAMEWVAAVFWTVDVCLNFMRATYMNSELVWDCKQVAKHYIRTWFFVDLVVIVPDWVVLFSGDHDMDAMNFLRGFRLLKLMRLLRLVKLERVIRGVQARINSNFSIHCLRIMRLVACIVILNHLLACVWYRIGVSSDDGWAKASLEADPFYGYWTSLHWSLTQFHGAMEVVPNNAIERIFAVVVVLVALIVFSQFLSSLTDMMIQLQRLRYDTTRQQDALRSYLTEHNISAYLSVRVKRYLEYQVDMQQRQDSQLAVLRVLPRNLLMDLHNEARVPLLTLHALFLHFHKEYPRAVRMLCHDAISQLPLQQGDVVFSAGDACGRMLFVDQGSLAYSIDPMTMLYMRGPAKTSDVAKGKQRWKLRKGQWICEIALWTIWVNCGELVALRSTMLLEIDAKALSSVLRHFEKAYLDAVVYAREFVDEANLQRSATDLDIRRGSDRDDETEECDQALEPLERRIGRLSSLTSSSSPSRSRVRQECDAGQEPLKRRTGRMSSLASSNSPERPRVGSSIASAASSYGSELGDSDPLGRQTS